MYKSTNFIHRVKQAVLGKVCSGRTCHFEKKKLRKDVKPSFLSFSAFYATFFVRLVSRYFAPYGEQPEALPLVSTALCKGRPHPLLRSGSCGSCLESKRRFVRSAKSPSETWRGAISTFRLLQLPTPGTTQVPAQPLGAEHRGGGACGR